MLGLLEATGGIAVVNDLFSADQIQETIKKIFESDSEDVLTSGFNVTIEIKVFIILFTSYFIIVCLYCYYIAFK